MYDCAAKAFVLGLVLLAGSQTRDGDLLDLTRGSAPTSESQAQGRGGSGAGIGVGPKSFGSLPLELKLLKLEGDDLHMGDALVLEVSLKNIGQEPFVIPWSGDFAGARPKGYELATPPGFRAALLSLVVNHDSREECFLLGQDFYGSDVSIGSLRELAPGAAVIIRGRCRLDFMNSRINSEYVERLPTQLTVKARLTISDSTYRGAYRPLVSENALILRIGVRE
jgi:hypothetical protein